MANPRHLTILNEGLDAWNRWREQKPEVRPDLVEVKLVEANLYRANLRGADLRQANLNKASLYGAELQQANLEGANLRNADLRRANLREANLCEADLREALLSQSNFSRADLKRAKLGGANLDAANLGNADLRGADLRGANLRGRVNLRGTILSGVDFSDAGFGQNVFADVDLSTAKGLEYAKHSGPSTIGIDTIYKSRGNIPELFLRGAGVPDNFIAYIGSLVGKPIEFYSCFISYSTKDQAFADRLYADLQSNGVRCWFAPHDMASGKKVHEQIDEAIRLHDRLLLILSPDSLASSWVETEIAKARKREVREQRRVLFPVRLVDFESLRDWGCFDADTGKDSAREIREFFIPDFSEWKNHDSYQQAFERLLRDLKTEGGDRTGETRSRS